MKFKSQILVEVIVGLSVFILVAILIFALFTIVSKSLKLSEEALVVYNLSSNYSYILLGIARENFSQLDKLEENVSYFLSPTSTGYEIIEGRELYPYKLENYYVWFTIENKTLEGDPSQKLLRIYVQSPNTLKSSLIVLTNLKERAIFQDEWKEATSSIIVITPTTSLIYYSTKTENVNINGEVYLP